MARLLYYENERKEFPKEFGTNLNTKEADAIIRKLIRHYKLDNYNSWSFVGTTSSRCITRHETIYNKKIHGKFKFSRTHTSIGVICHELAHAIETIKYGRSTHAKRHFNIMKRLINYCRKMGYVKSNDVVMIINGEERNGMSCMAIQMRQYIKTMKEIK
jgi:hypothetical protein